MLEKTNTLTRKQRFEAEDSEYSEIFESISSNNIQKLNEFILNKKIKIWEVKKSDNLTILHNACAMDKTNIVINIIHKMKIRLGLDNNNDNNDNISTEEKSKNEKIFKDFINAKTDGDNQTALHYASFRGNIELIKLLISNYAEINALTNTGYNMIHKAAMGNKPSAIVYFNKKYNMNLEDTDENKMNALHLAVRNNMENSVIFLLSLGLDPNIRDKDGCTALHYAVRKGQARIIKKLLQRGADKNLTDYKGKTPVTIAKNKDEIKEIFRKKGVCEKLFFKPDISKKTLCSNKNMILFIVMHIIIIIFVFFLILPYFDNNIFSICFIVESFFFFFLYTILSCSNPGKMVNHEYMDLLDIVDKGNDVEEYCPYCLVKRKFRSKHCLICLQCVDEFDHHCFWVGNCIGKKNYTLFFIFLIYILLNTLFIMGINIYYLVNEISVDEIKNESSSIPGFIFGNTFIYNKIFRIVASVCIFIICFLFFIPLFNLFRMQVNTALEKRQIRIDEEEYEKEQLREKLDDEVWEDLKFDEDSERESVEMDVKICDFERDSNPH